MRYCIARPINGVTINGNEYVLNDSNEIMVFNAKKTCLEFIKKYIDSNNSIDYLFAYEERIWKNFITE